ncbi:hypothetical protein KIN20_012789 [Parelaphostrongylus tenuis]|uniref:Uncharacterized protein n=1 Tax=Parelaphostrongylus tenuis TaxID=148309 RepID=A0AAD5MWP4_PARTN|nr:hypothetical protein KIN20_012789 [Parelaphostrongylus tenuis]
MLVQFFVGFHRQLNSSTPHFGNGQYLHLPRLSVYNNYFHSNEGTLANVTSTNSKSRVRIDAGNVVALLKKILITAMHSQEKSKERRSQRAMKYITLKIRGGPSNKAMEWKVRED